MLKRKKEGKPLPETEDMKIWREEFDQMTQEDHVRVLKNLGIDDEELEEFKEDLSAIDGETIPAENENKNVKAEKWKKTELKGKKK